MKRLELTCLLGGVVQPALRGLLLQLHQGFFGTVPGGQVHGA